MLQLPLGVRLRDASRFENFLAGQNGEAVHAAKSVAAAQAPSVLWFWGSRGSGRSHLLQAACAAASAKPSAYLPMTELAAMDPGVLAGLELLGIVAIDDVDEVAGRANWERALFNLYNAASEHGASLIRAAGAPPANIRWGLGDLASRFSAATVFHLRPLNDQDLTKALKQRATLRGLELPDDSADFLLKRYPRDMHTLCAVLDMLDEASLVAQRRLTVPFLKQVLERKRS
jgi:DnaA family protein